MKFGIFVALCNASIKPVKFEIGETEKDVKQSSKTGYAGWIFPHDPFGEPTRNCTDLYIENFNMLADFYSSLIDDTYSENFHELDEASLMIYSIYMNPYTFIKPESSLFVGNYPSILFKYIYEKKLRPILNTPNLDIKPLLEIFNFYENFIRRLAEDGKISKDSGMFPFQEMSGDLLKGLLFIKSVAPMNKSDELNELIKSIMKCLSDFNYQCFRLYRELSRTGNRGKPMTEFQNEYFQKLLVLADNLAVHHASFRYFIRSSAPAIHTSERVFMYTVNKFSAVESMMHMLSLLSFKTEKDALMIDCRFWDALTRTVVHTVISSLRTDLHMQNVISTIRASPEWRSRITSFTSQRVYDITNQKIVETFKFVPKDKFDFSDIPDEIFDNVCSYMILRYSEDLLELVFDENVSFLTRNETLYNALLELFVSIYDGKYGIPIKKLMLDAQIEKLKKKDFENTCTFSGMVHSALNKLFPCVDGSDAGIVKCLVEIYALYDSIHACQRVKASGADTLDSVFKFAYLEADTAQDLVKSAKETKVLKLKKNCRNLKIVVTLLGCAAAVISVIIFVLVFYRNK